jgi:RNA polymerase sigma factor for flagellar operon FliA
MGGADTAEVRTRIEENLDLVAKVARQTRRQFGTYVRLEDLEGTGREALVVAARNFETDRGVTFRNWAFIRIRGAMLDAMRAEGNVPKRVYQKLRALQAADQVHEVALEENAAAPPTTAEAADEKLGSELASAALAMAMNFLHIQKGDALAKARDTNDTPEEATLRADLLAKVRAAIDARPDAERTLLSKHYFEEVSLEQAGKELGLSKSWASRLHARALEAIAKDLLPKK